MANKALAKRQKLGLRAFPSLKGGLPRNPTPPPKPRHGDPATLPAQTPQQAALRKPRRERG